MVDRWEEARNEEQEKATNVDLLSKFVLLYSTYINTPRDYGTGQLMSMVEVHVLADIYENPGITVTELARRWRRTKGAISQTVSKLEEKGFIHREKEQTDAKVIHLYVTIQGEELCNAHRAYDDIHIAETMDILLQECTMADIKSFHKVMAVFVNRLGESSLSDR